MIEISEAPIINNKRMFVAMPDFNSNHIFDLSEYDMLIYYQKLFEHRTDNDKPYIDKYNSLEELEEDIYRDCTHIDKGDWTTKDFKDIYNTLNKNEFLDKINQLIMTYGNMINTYTLGEICIKTDEPIKLLSFIKSQCPNETIETWSMVYE